MGSREQPGPGEDISTEGETLEERTDNFFKREYKAFHAEKNKNFHDIPRKYPTIDFDELIREFEGEGKDPKKKCLSPTLIIPESHKTYLKIECKDFLNNKMIF